MRRRSLPVDFEGFVQRSQMRLEVRLNAAIRIGPAHDGENGKQQYVRQPIEFALGATRVRDCGEQRQKRLQGLQGLQGDLPSIRSPHTDSDFFAPRNRPLRLSHQELENCCIWDSVESVEQIWPVTVAERIDPAIKALLRKLVSLAAAGSRTKRKALAAETQTAFGAVQQDLELLRYEPSSIRPDRAWIDRRSQIVSAVASLQAPLLLFADQSADESDDVRHRLDRVAENFGADSAHESKAFPAPSPRETEKAVSSATLTLVEGPVGGLEQAVAGSLADERKEKEIYALA